MISDWTQAVSFNPDKSRLGNLMERGAARDLYLGGIDSPSKRVKHAEQFKNLRAFWGGWGDEVAESGRKQAQILHTVFVSTTTRTGPMMSDASLNFSNNFESDMGLMKERESESGPSQGGEGGLD